MGDNIPKGLRPEYDLLITKIREASKKLMELNQTIPKPIDGIDIREALFDVQIYFTKQ